MGVWVLGLGSSRGCRHSFLLHLTHILLLLLLGLLLLGLLLLLLLLLLGLVLVVVVWSRRFLTLRAAGRALGDDVEHFGEARGRAGLLLGGSSAKMGEDGATAADHLLAGPHRGHAGLAREELLGGLRRREGKPDITREGKDEEADRAIQKSRKAPGGQH